MESVALLCVVFGSTAVGLFLFAWWVEAGNALRNME